MGQSQSSSTDSQVDSEQPLKRDYYELLSIERTATDDEIKKAYRRKALELHPDRNYGNEEGATRLFAEVQAAYEVLSDPQERAWYDSHRDVLLRGESVGADGSMPGGENFAYGSKMTGAEDVLKLMMKFNSRVEFTDALNGFYGGLSEFFEKLAKEEDIAAQWEGEDIIEYPPYGNKSDDYEDIVKPFYAAWNGFATKKSYAWKDKWKLSDAPDRRIRRLMEKENKKIRDEAVFEFNDSVRSLVAFVRKRDPRVQNNQKSEVERQKALKDLAAAQAARSRAQREAEMESFDLPEWARSREQEKDELEGGFSSEEEQEQHEYDCVVCDKTFKSEKQFQVHEKSKKHIKLLKELKREMKKEGKILDLGQNEQPDEPKLVLQDEEQTNENDVDALTHGEIAIDAETQRTAPDPPHKTNQSNTVSEADSHDDGETSEEGDIDSDYAPRTVFEQRLASNENASDSDANSAEVETLTSSLRASTITSVRGTDSGTGATTPTTFDDGDAEARSQQQEEDDLPKLGKAKQKRVKKAAAAVATTAAAISKGSAGGPSSNSMSGRADGEFKCAVCQSGFTSKTKLFNHISEEKHAAPISQVKGGNAGGRGSGTRSGKGKKR